MNWKYASGVLLVIALILSGLLVYNLTTVEKPRELKQLTLMLDWFPQGRYAPFYYALDKGYYAEQGIALQLIRGQGSAFAIQQVDQGRADLGLAEFSTLIVNLAKGVKVKSIMVTQERSPVGFISWRESPIKTAKDLEGRTFGMAPFAAVRFLLPVVMKRNGADMSKVKVELVDVGALYTAALQGKFDASEGHYDGGWVRYKRAAKEQGVCCPQIIMLSDWGADIYGYSVIARPEFLDKNPDLVRRFLAATMKGAREAFAHPEDALETIIKNEPALEKTKDAVRDEWNNAMELMKYAKEYGYATREKLQTSISIVTEGYNLSSMDADTVHINGYLPIRS